MTNIIETPDFSNWIEKAKKESFQNVTNYKFVPEERKGKLTEIQGTVLRAFLPWVCQGELCHILPDGIEAEVTSISGSSVYLSPFTETTGLKQGMEVVSFGAVHKMALGDYLKGKVVDGLGRLLYDDNKSNDWVEEWRPLDAYAPDALKRKIISDPLPLGVKAIDGLLTCGQGQRIGIFAAAGGGKSTLLSMVCDGTIADTTVLALVGERGREVREFLEVTLSKEARKKTIVVVSTSDKSALERMKASFTATTIAEFFRDKGQNVLLMLDSLTRYARAAREIGLASGEPPVASGYPPSVFATLPRLLERAGPAEVGSITAIYTVLVEADNLNEPISDEVRSILDGHIVLSRSLAESNHYPAIDVLASVSRVMPQITKKEHMELAGKLRKMWSLYKEVEILLRVGEYKKGQDLEADEAITRWPMIQSFLKQATDDHLPFDEIINKLELAVNGPI